MVQEIFERAMERTTNIYEVVADIQARKEKAQKQPAHAMFREIKAELGGMDDGTLHAILDAEVDSGLIRRVRTINGYAYCVAEE